MNRNPNSARSDIRDRRPWLLFAAALGFVAGMLVMAAIVTMFPSGAESASARVEAAAARPVEVKPTKKEEPAPVSTPPATVALPVMSANPIADLRDRALTLPVEGIKREDLHDTFNEQRGGTRKHEALDIIAPRHTPVFAVDDGTIAKLFFSDAGGITIYQFDPGKTYCYYYAHLQKYADGLTEGQTVKRGDVIGYVGTTGNAPRETPHLHFAIFRLGDNKRWWEGTPIDPYSVLR